ncbi:MAG: PVC-type heme-binding CxxCH protein [Planctomycetota bacterium]
MNVPRFVCLLGTLVQVASAFLVPSGAVAENTRAAADPAQELASFKLPEGFEIQLYASDPEIAKPIQMNFDAAGRLWLVTSQSYPQLRPGADPEDKVYVLEDQDGDGKAEKARVFAEGLHIPTGIEIGDGGIYVGNATELWHLSDTNGDGKADRTRPLLAGFGTEDTHHLIHTFRWGPGGILYFAQAVYIHSHVETPWGVRRMDGGGYWQYRPESAWLKEFVRGMTNSWGIAFDRFGQAFGVDNDNTSLNYFVPGARLIRTPGESMFLPSIVRDKPKYCGAEIITGRHFPEDWSDNLVTCDFRAHRVCRYRLKEAGSGFEGEELEPLVTSDNPAFRPIDVKLGPDGALYICDWYNPIINHGEVDFRDPRRDKTHGRVWRVVAKDRPLVTRPTLTHAAVAELLEQQKSPEGWTRHFASRILADRPRSGVIPELETWTNAQQDEEVLLRAVWLYQTLDLPHQPLLDRLLAASDGRIRAAATRVLSYWLNRVANPRERLAKLVRDSHPRVRLEAVRALAEMPSMESFELVLEVLDQPMDPFLEYAVKLTARELAPQWLAGFPAIAPGLSKDQAAKRWTFALLALDSPKASAPLLELWRNGVVADDDRDKVLASIAKFGQPDELRVILDQLANASPEEKIKLLGSLGEAHRLRGVQPSGDLAASLSPWIDGPEEKARIEAIRLGSQWKLEGWSEKLVALAKSESEPEAVRSIAIESLGSLGAADSSKRLRELVNDFQDSAWRHRAVIALIGTDPKMAAALLKTEFASAKEAKDVTALFEAFVKQKAGPSALAGSLADITLSEVVAREGVRVVQSSGQPATDLLAALAKAGNLPETTREITPEQLQKMAAQVASQGSPERGEAIYRREKLNCVKCHAIRGTGGEVGPDLTTIGASAPVDYLLESLLDPNKKVKENYHSMIVATASGEVITGIPVRKTEEEIVLRNAEQVGVDPARDVEESRPGLDHARRTRGFIKCR